MPEIEKYDSIIYMRDIQLEITMPKKYVWEFIEQFGEVFSLRDPYQGQVNRNIEKYHDHPNGWHITIVIHENEEENFYQFFYAFCLKREISFHLPENSNFTKNFLIYHKFRENKVWFKRYEGKWAAFIGGKFVTAFDKRGELMEKLMKKYPDTYVFTTRVKSPEEDLKYHIFKEPAEY